MRWLIALLPILADTIARALQKKRSKSNDGSGDLTDRSDPGTPGSEEVCIKKPRRLKKLS
jgi:hypothetical protein